MENIHICNLKSPTSKYDAANIKYVAEQFSNVLNNLFQLVKQSEIDITNKLVDIQNENLTIKNQFQNLKDTANYNRKTFTDMNAHNLGLFKKTSHKVSVLMEQDKAYVAFDKMQNELKKMPKTNIIFT